jgi:hypothetical protein
MGRVASLGPCTYCCLPTSRLLEVHSWVGCSWRCDQRSSRWCWFAMRQVTRQLAKSKNPHHVIQETVATAVRFAKKEL